MVLGQNCNVREWLELIICADGIRSNNVWPSTNTPFSQFLFGLNALIFWFGLDEEEDGSLLGNIGDGVGCPLAMAKEEKNR